MASICHPNSPNIVAHTCFGPEREDNWRNNADPAQAVFKQVIQTIAKYEPVVVGTNKDQYLNLSRNEYAECSGR